MVRRCGLVRSLTVHEVPNDIIPNILSNLPLKSLCRFKCVSKSWRSLIITKFHESPKRPIFVRLSDFLYNDFTIYSVNGNGLTNLVCALTSRPPKFRFPKQHKGLFYDFCAYDKVLAVFNPSTLENLVLPKYNTFGCTDPSWRFDPFELGFDPSSDKYKMLNLINYPHCEILTLGTTSWRPLHSDGTEVLRGCGRPSTHSICIDGTLYLYSEATNKIISFQLATESIRAIEGPKRVASERGWSVVIFLFELEGCLCLADRHIRFNLLDLWMLKDGYNTNDVDHSWVMLTTLTPPATDIAWILPYSTRSGEIVIAKDNSSRRNLYLYSFITRRFHTVRVAGLASNFVVENYVENPVSLQNL